MVVIISHLALTTSCSLSFYIYFAMRGEGLRRARRSFHRILSLVASFRSQRGRRDSAGGDLNLDEIGLTEIGSPLEERSSKTKKKGGGSVRRNLKTIKTRSF